MTQLPRDSDKEGSGRSSNRKHKCRRRHWHRHRRSRSRSHSPDATGRHGDRSLAVVVTAMSEPRASVATSEPYVIRGSKRVRCRSEKRDGLQDQYPPVFPKYMCPTSLGPSRKSRRSQVRFEHRPDLGDLRRTSSDQGPGERLASPPDPRSRTLVKRIPTAPTISNTATLVLNDNQCVQVAPVTCPSASGVESLYTTSSNEILSTFAKPKFLALPVKYTFSDRNEVSELVAKRKTEPATIQKATNLISGQNLSPASPKQFVASPGTIKQRKPSPLRLAKKIRISDPPIIDQRPKRSVNDKEQCTPRSLRSLRTPNSPTETLRSQRTPNSPTETLRSQRTSNSPTETPFNTLGCVLQKIPNETQVPKRLLLGRAKSVGKKNTGKEKDLNPQPVRKEYEGNAKCTAEIPQLLHTPPHISERANEQKKCVQERMPMVPQSQNIYERCAELFRRRIPIITQPESLPEDDLEYFGGQKEVDSLFEEPKDLLNERRLSELQGRHEHTRHLEPPRSPQEYNAVPLGNCLDDSKIKSQLSVHDIFLKNLPIRQKLTDRNITFQYDARSMNERQPITKKIKLIDSATNTASTSPVTTPSHYSQVSCDPVVNRAPPFPPTYAQENTKELVVVFKNLSHHPHRNFLGGQTQEKTFEGSRSSLTSTTSSYFQNTMDRWSSESINTDTPIPRKIITENQCHITADETKSSSKLETPISFKLNNLEEITQVLKSIFQKMKNTGPLTKEISTQSEHIDVQSCENSVISPSHKEEHRTENPKPKCAKGLPNRKFQETKVPRVAGPSRMVFGRGRAKPNALCYTCGRLITRPTRPTAIPPTSFPATLANSTVPRPLSRAKSVLGTPGLHSKAKPRNTNPTASQLPTKCTQTLSK